MCLIVSSCMHVRSSVAVKQMLIASKVPDLARMAKRAEREGMAVVIGLQATGEANTMSALGLNANGCSDDDGLTDACDFVSAPHQVLKGLIEKQFPTHAYERHAHCIVGLQLQVRQSIRSWRAAASSSSSSSSSSPYAARRRRRQCRHKRRRRRRR